MTEGDAMLKDVSPDIQFSGRVGNLPLPSGFPLEEENPVAGRVKLTSAFDAFRAGLRPAPSSFSLDCLLTMSYVRTMEEPFLLVKFSDESLSCCKPRGSAAEALILDL